MTNQPPATRAELVTFCARRLEEEYNNKLHVHRLHDTCSDFVACLEDWTKPWDGICEDLEIFNEGRPNLVGMMMICMYEQLVKPEHRISANKYTAEGYRKAADVLVQIFEDKTGRIWDQFYERFNPKPRSKIMGMPHDGGDASKEGAGLGLPGNVACTPSPTQGTVTEKALEVAK